MSQPRPVEYSEKVGYLEKEDAMLMILHLSKEIPKMSKKFSFDLSPNQYIMESDDFNSAKDKLKNEPDWVEHLKTKIENIRCSDAEGAVLLGFTRQLSRSYSQYKLGNESESIRNMVQCYADVFSSIMKLDFEIRMIIGFIFNAITNRDFFNIIENTDNPRMKVLRNMREHDNLIIDKLTWDSNLRRIIPMLCERYSKAELKNLEEEVKKGQKLIFYDMNSKKPKKDKNGTILEESTIKVTHILIEEPKLFLKKMVTLCHIQMFILGLNSKMIMSRELFKDFWVKKYPKLDKRIKEMTLVEFNNQLNAEFDKRNNEKSQFSDDSGLIGLM